VLTHEVGHLIGLDHTPDFSATMYAGYEPGTTEQRSIEEDDLLAVCAAYPPERDATCAPDPKGGIGFECGGVAPGADGEEDDEGCSVTGAKPASRTGWIVGLWAACAAAWTRRAARVRA